TDFSSSELKAQRELNQARIHRSSRDHTEQIRIARIDRLVTSEAPNLRADGNSELSMIEQIEELRSELKRFAFCNRRQLRNGKIEVGLARTTNDTHAGIAEASSQVNGWRRAERSDVEESSCCRIASTAQTLLHTALCGDIVICHTGTKLR